MKKLKIRLHLYIQLYQGFKPTEVVAKFIKNAGIELPKSVAAKLEVKAKYRKIKLDKITAEKLAAQKAEEEKAAEATAA